MAKPQEAQSEAETSSGNPETKLERYEVAGHMVLVAQETRRAVVWLNTESLDYDGICIGCGETRQEAVDTAVKALKAVIVRLNQPTS
jgi:hypothetical protein